jgi:hypothetical protein
VRNDVNLDEAQAWVDRSLAMRETYGGLRIEAALVAEMKWKDPPVRNGEGR